MPARRHRQGTHAMRRDAAVTIRLFAASSPSAAARPSNRTPSPRRTPPPSAGPCSYKGWVHIRSRSLQASTRRRSSQPLFSLPLFPPADAPGSSNARYGVRRPRPAGTRKPACGGARAGRWRGCMLPGSVPRVLVPGCRRHGGGEGGGAPGHHGHVSVGDHQAQLARRLAACACVHTQI